MATRSNAALLTSLVYSALPLAPATDDFFTFFVWMSIFAIYWDFHFYWAHRWAHENKWAYTFFHKTHHVYKEPNCFGAYFVTYQSHILLEQSVVIICAYMGLPRNVFEYYLY